MPESIRVVIADDNDGVRTLIRIVVELDGRLCVVGEACDGQQTLAVVAAQLPDVLLLDLGMPALDGLQVLEALCLSHPAVRVVVYSGFAGKEICAAALAAGAADYLVKGADPTLVVERLAAAGR